MRRYVAIMADLEIPRPFDLRQFLAQVAAQRNRTIFLHPFTSGPGIPCGLCRAKRRRYTYRHDLTMREPRGCRTGVLHPHDSTVLHSTHSNPAPCGCKRLVLFLAGTASGEDRLDDG